MENKPESAFERAVDRRCIVFFSQVSECPRAITRLCFARRAPAPSPADAPQVETPWGLASARQVPGPGCELCGVALDASDGWGRCAACVEAVHRTLARVGKASWAGHASQRADEAAR